MRDSKNVKLLSQTNIYKVKEQIKLILCSRKDSHTSYESFEIENIIKRITSGKMILTNPEHLCCSKVFYAGHSILSYSKMIALLTLEQFFNKEQFQKVLCFAANSKGYILIGVSQKQIVEGILLNQNTKMNIRKWIKMAGRHLVPILKENEIKISFVPVLDEKTLQHKGNYVIRISLQTIQSRVLFCVNQNKYQQVSYIYDQKEAWKISGSELYRSMQQKYKKKERKLLHKQDKCEEPLEVEFIYEKNNIEIWIEEKVKELKSKQQNSTFFSKNYEHHYAIKRKDYFQRNKLQKFLQQMFKEEVSLKQMKKIKSLLTLSSNLPLSRIQNEVRKKFSEKEKIGAIFKIEPNLRIEIENTKTDNKQIKFQQQIQKLQGTFETEFDDSFKIQIFKEDKINIVQLMFKDLEQAFFSYSQLPSFYQPKFLSTKQLLTDSNFYFPLSHNCQLQKQRILPAQYSHHYIFCYTQNKLKKFESLLEKSLPKYKISIPFKDYQRKDFKMWVISSNLNQIKMYDILKETLQEVSENFQKIKFQEIKERLDIDSDQDLAIQQKRLFERKFGKKLMMKRLNLRLFHLTYKSQIFVSLFVAMLFHGQRIKFIKQQ